MDETQMKMDEQTRNLYNALRYFVGKIVQDELGSTKVPSPQFVSALTGLVITLLTDHLPKELIAFAQHAGRKSISDEDFLLYLRKTSLQQAIIKYRDVLNDLSPNKPEGTNKRGRKPKAKESDDDVIEI